MRVYGYVVMPEHVHLLLSEPEKGTLAEATHYLKLSFTKRLHNRWGTDSTGTWGANSKRTGGARNRIRSGENATTTAM